MAFASRYDLTKKFKKQSFFSEAKVWGVEEFLSGEKRKVNPHWANLWCDSNSEEYSNCMKTAGELHNIARDSMTDEKIMSELEIKFNFIQNAIDNTANFSSRNFDWWDTKD